MLALMLPGVAWAEGPAFVGTCEVLTWHANPEPVLAGYRLFDNGQPISTVGPVTTVPCAPLQLGVGQHALQLSAYDTSGNESALSAPPVPFIVLAQAPGPMAQPSLSLSSAGGTTLPYSGSTLLTITGTADALTLDRGAPGGSWPAQWPTGALASEFTRTPTGWTVPLCLSCYPAPGRYALTVTATNAAGSTTATLPITIGTVAPPVPTERMTVTRPSLTTIVITAPKTQCAKLTTSTAGTTATSLKRTITCTP